YLLIATRSLNSLDPLTYSRTFTPFNQYSTLLSGDTLIVPWFHSPISRMNRGFWLEVIRSYSDARVLFPSLPNFASGCLSSSSIWYSRPIADPVLPSLSVTKYLTPLLAPSVSLKSNFSSNALYSFSVTISPPFVDFAPSYFNTLNTTSLIS